MNVPSEEAVNALKEKYGRDAWVKTVQLEYESSRYFSRIKEIIEHDRIGEVVFAVERPNHKFIAVRSREYPEGIFRIPTGGICHGENIVEAVRREVLEELGLTARIVRFIGLYRTKIVNGSDHIWFHSFFFHLQEAGGELLIDATDDEVSEIKEVDADGLNRLSRHLADIEPGWKDWGAFRFLTTNVIADYAESLKQDL